MLQTHYSNSIYVLLRGISNASGLFLNHCKFILAADISLMYNDDIPGMEKNPIYSQTSCNEW